MVQKYQTSAQFHPSSLQCWQNSLSFGFSFLPFIKKERKAVWKCWKTKSILKQLSLIWLYFQSWNFRSAWTMAQIIPTSVLLEGLSSVPLKFSSHSCNSTGILTQRTKFVDCVCWHVMALSWLFQRKTLLREHEFSFQADSFGSLALPWTSKINWKGWVYTGMAVAIKALC